MKKLLLALVMLFSTATFADAQNPFGRNPNITYRNYRVVGYRPNIMWLPSGTYFSTGPAIVGPNRRYVRFGINVGFSNISGVSTFNFVTGQTRRIR